MLRTHVVWLTIPLLAGCSLVFDGSAYEGSGNDAGVEDSGAMDAGADAAAVDAGGVDAGGRLPCATQDDCLESESVDHYVCAPEPMSTTGQFYCVAECEAPEDCGAIGGGSGHDSGSICLATGDCGCETGTDCEHPLFPACDRASQRCEETACTTNMDCMATMSVCFGGFCQRILCASASECTGERSTSACVPPPPGMTGTFCSDTCFMDPNCPTGMTCTGGRCVPGT